MNDFSFFSIGEVIYGLQLVEILIFNKLRK